MYIPASTGSTYPLTLGTCMHVHQLLIMVSAMKMASTHHHNSMCSVELPMTKLLWIFETKWRIAANTCLRVLITEQFKFENVQYIVDILLLHLWILEIASAIIVLSCLKKKQIYNLPIPAWQFQQVSMALLTVLLLTKSLKMEWHGLKCPFD